MKRVYMLLALIAVVALTGCGGGGGGNSPNDPTGPVSISISPTTATLSPGDNQVFTATVTGTNNNAVAWEIEEGSEGGTITTLTASTARYTAPDVWNTFHIKVTSQADRTKSATATVSVRPPGPPD